MQRYELEAWLGPALDDLTAEQVDGLQVLADEAESYWPADGAYAADLESALSTAMQIMLGETAASQIAHELRRARTGARRALVASQQAAYMLVMAGETQARAAELTGLDRMTVRKRLGK